MADEEKYRVESPEEEETEKKGFFRPLPEKEQQFKIVAGERPQPIVKLIGISMREKKRDLLLLLLMPFLTALIDVAIFSFVSVNIWEGSATYLFYIPTLAAIPIGLVVSETGPALVGGFLSAAFFMVIFVIFLMSPVIMVPTLGAGEFFISGIALAIGYIIFVVVASLLGSIIGTIMREFL
ncbi:MAG: hypothetical protein ACFFDV_02510 [Candidatus Thorarchaeota archaeon]